MKTHAQWKIHFVKLIILVVLYFNQAVIAQERKPCFSGVYKTSDDFVHDRLSYKINTADKGYKLDFTFPADLTLTLKIKDADTTMKFRPGSIYGFRECDQIYRFFPGGKELNAQEDYYKIEEAGSLILYSSVFISGEEIFYSRDLTAPIHRLTWRNLKNDFKDDPAFIAAAQKLKRHPDGLATRSSNGFEILKLYEARHPQKNSNQG
jgi:hypothetical protein